MVTQFQLDSTVVSWRDVDDEVIALDLGNSRYLAMNGTGAMLWKTLAAGASRDRLVELLTDEFDVDTAQAAADVEAFLESLSSQGLLTQAP